ncbi:MAG TPA: T9SS type A sorting domain-containing protein [Rubricoccaceae bacterium]|jgi:hypothetical protein
MLPSVPHRRFAGAGRWLGLAFAVMAIAMPASAQRTVTLRMNSATMPDTLKADQALAGAQVRGQLASGTALPGGGVIDWGSNTTVRPTNVSGDYWQVQFQIPDNDLLNFKFFFEQSDRPASAGGPGIGGYEDGDNYQIPAGTGPVTLDLHYFNKTGGPRPYDWRPFQAGGDSVAVWFRVYMRTTVAVNNGYTRDDPALRVSLRGNFGERNAVGAGGAIADWSSTPGAPAALLRRESNDPSKPGYDMYSGLVRYPASSAGLTQTYKFFFEDTDTNTDARSYEAGISDRTFRIPAAGRDTTLFYKFFSNSRAASAAPLVTSAVTFAVDVRPLSDAGVFQVADDQIQVRGPFNDWGCPAANTDNCLLGRIPSSFTYTNQIPVTSQANSTVPYKYYVNFTPALANPDNGYEEPLDFGGGDRSFTFQGASGGQSLGTQFFDDIRPNNVIATGQTINVGFEVDMRPALTFSPRAFNPATDQVTIFFQDPIWKITQGYNPVNDTPVPNFFLTDPDGNGIYTGSLPVRGPTYNGIGYQVAFGNGTDPYVTEGAGGTQPGRRRYRYVLNRTASSYQFARDVIRPTTVPLPWEINPTGTFTPGQIPNSRLNGFVDPGLVANEDGPGRAGELQLSALAPNPTTGIARMTVRTAEGEALTVRVYDVMGRLVTTAVEGVRSTGEQSVQIDTQGLAAGVYVVRAEAGTSVATRRLTVIR